MDTVETFMKQYPSVRFVVIFGELEVQKISSLLQMGIKGFINSTISREEFVKALGKVHSGNHYFAANIFENGFEAPTEEINNSHEEDNNLTNREAEVLELISHGYTTREIAQQLKISKRTVDGHRARLLNKIGVRNTAGLVRYALGFKLREKHMSDYQEQ
jgi:DNA-binding NarL/FixJ family response regulator